MGKQWKQWQTSFWGGSKITADGDCSHEIKRRLLLGRKAMTSLDCILKSGDIALPTKFHLAKVNSFFSSHVWMWELDCKESWALKNWCFWTVVLEKTLERVPWTARRSNQSILKKISPKYSLEGLMLKLKLQYWSLDVKNWLTGKDPDAGKGWRWEEKGTTEDEMVGWHHWLNEHEFESTPGIGDGQGSLAAVLEVAKSWIQSDWTELNWTVRYQKPKDTTKDSVFEENF